MGWVGKQPVSMRKIGKPFQPFGKEPLLGGSSFFGAGTPFGMVSKGKPPFLRDGFPKKTTYLQYPLRDLEMRRIE